MRLYSILLISLSALYSSLDPTSVAEHFAFYELYPKTPEGKEALRTAWSLLSQGRESTPEMVLPQLDPKPLIEFVNRVDRSPTKMLNEEELAVVNKLSNHLQNRSLKGHGIWSVNEIHALPLEEVDLARALMIQELEGDDEIKAKVLSYEASIDLMALQIQASLKSDSSSKEKIRAINDYIFSQMRFRFPPHSLHAKEIDVYTFLPSVIDGRRGVCLGVSILYLSLAQRLGLELEAITPPGHIYVRSKDLEEEINIETTARGIDYPSEVYLGIETRALQKRNIKEVIGLAFMNQAAVCWRKENYQKAIDLYEKAKPYFDDDYLLNMFLGFNYLFVGRKKEGEDLLKKVVGKVPDHAISEDTVAEDYLLGNMDEKAIQAIFREVDESRTSILQKQAELKKICAMYPKFRQGLFHLSITYLQLGKEKEVIPLLEKYIRMNPNDASAEYYLSVLHYQRNNFNQAWKHLKSAEKIVFAKDHHPKALKQLKKQLIRSCPEPSHFL